MVDIIIRAKNGHEYTNRCIESILRMTEGIDYRIILVDDGSDPPQTRAGVDILIRNETSQGAVTATNMGLGASMTVDSGYVMVMDNDTRIPEGDTGWLVRFVKELEQYPDTACVGATSNYVNMPQHVLGAPQTYTGDWQEERDGKVTNSGCKENPAVVWFVSFCVLFRKSVLAQCGLWDTRYNPGNWEDTDYSMTVRSNRWKIRVARSVFIFHEGHKTFGSNLKRLMLENQEKFSEKWGMGRLLDMGVIPPEEFKKIMDKTYDAR